MIDDTRALVAAYERSTAEGHDGCPDTSDLRLRRHQRHHSEQPATQQPLVGQLQCAEQGGPAPGHLAGRDGPPGGSGQPERARRKPVFASAFRRSLGPPLAVAVPEGSATDDGTPGHLGGADQPLHQPDTPARARTGQHRRPRHAGHHRDVRERGQRPRPSCPPTFVEQRIQTAVDAGQFPAGDGIDLLCHRRASAAPNSTRPTRRGPGRDRRHRAGGHPVQPGHPRRRRLRTARPRPRRAAGCARCTRPTPSTRTSSSSSSGGAARNGIRRRRNASARWATSGAG